MSKKTTIVFHCDSPECKNITVSRLSDNWVSVKVFRAYDDDTDGGECKDACSPRCAGIIAGLETELTQGETE
jgi:hypothetical protein